MSNQEQSVSQNPATTEIIQRYTRFSSQVIEQKIIATYQQWHVWRKKSLEDRAILVKKLAQLLKNKKTEYAELMTNEMGKPITQSLAEVEKCAWLCEFYAENCFSYLAPRMIKTDMSKSYVAYNPLGVILGVMPWNFPFWQVMRFAIPSLLAGNTCLLKHAANVTGCGLALEQLFKEAGFADHAFTFLLIGSEQVESVVSHPLVAAASLTGSERAGKQIASEAGKVLKKVVLELGGSDPYIVLADADLDKTADAIILSRLSNAGQSCIAAKRILIVKEVYDELLKRIMQRVTAYDFDNPLLTETKLGPMAREDLRTTLHKQVQATLSAGAQLECGGFIPDQKGFYYPASVLSQVPLNSVANQEELFGPVICLFKVENYQKAIEIANSSHFGLSSAVFTKDISLAEKMAMELQAGSVTINRHTISDPRMPFGGIKNSGYGRELGIEGIHEFTNIKAIAISE